MYCFPGFSLHDELALPVRAGFTPLDADPLTDIRNTQRIHAVTVRGRFIGPDAWRKPLRSPPAAGSTGRRTGCCH